MEGARVERLGGKATPLSGDELRVLFQVLDEGEDLGEARRRLPRRDRVTVNKAYNVAWEFSLRDLSEINDEVAAEIAKKAKYSATISYVQTLFLPWRRWRENQKSSAQSQAEIPQDVRCSDKDYLMRQTLRTLEAIPTSIKFFGDDIRHWLTKSTSMYPIVRSGLAVDESGNATVAPRAEADYRWPVAPAVIYEDGKGVLKVVVYGEQGTEWRCLQQHLCNDPVWAKYEDWKTALVASLASKGRLFDKLVSLVEDKAGLPVIDAKHCKDTTEPHLHPEVPYYLYEQAICRAYQALVGPRGPIPPITLDQFVHEAEGGVRLNGRMVIHRCDQERGARLIQCLIDFQHGLADLVEAREAVEAHRTEEHKTAELKGHIKRIRLMAGHPPGSSCDSCRPWLDAQVQDGL
jgi:hypothetical protein